MLICKFFIEQLILNSTISILIFIYIYILWGSKVWARDLGPGTMFHQQYARGEEITEDRCK